MVSAGVEIRPMNAALFLSNISVAGCWLCAGFFRKLAADFITIFHLHPLPTALPAAKSVRRRKAFLTGVISHAQRRPGQTHIYTHIHKSDTKYRDLLSEACARSCAVCVRERVTTTSKHRLSWNFKVFSF